ncbi:MAG: tRNA pseudouridine(38-40) synthase TruA [Bacteroidia bacterium]|jgi:tRNA pseudouridine38-40 synthase|nr:tRNA pseudouridine(38-40) synthase TruA [Bacteroidia bacterium]
MRYVIRLAYKGTNYHGWQKQYNALSVQSVLEEKLSLLIGANTETVGCGRTDTGVHAKDFVAHFDAPNLINDAQMVFKLNNVLPNDIVIYQIVKVPDDFNARFDAVKRTYEYWVTTLPNPFLTDQAWYQYGPLNIAAMNEAAAYLLGRKSFESFSKVHTQVNHFECEVFDAKWEYKEELLIFTITANRFLRNMVRAIVGTLMDVGRNKLMPDAIPQILSKQNRSVAGQSAPAHGLYLTQIDYPRLHS